MKFGIILSDQHPQGDPIVKRYQEHLEQVRAARDLGFDIVTTGQHYVAHPFQYLQPIPSLARVAAEAGEMRVGLTIMLLALHNPVHVAEEIATLDVITHGRFVFGVGLGYREAESEALGVPKKDWLGRFNEGLALIKRLWTEDNVTFEGKHFQVKDVTMTIRPVQQPMPIWIAANNDKAVRRAAREADAWILNPHARIDTLERQMGIFRDELARIGKPFPAELPIIKETYVAADDRTAFAEAQPFLGGKYDAYADWEQDKVLPGNESFRIQFEELARDRFIIGDPQRVRDEITKHHERLGTNTIIFRVQWPGLANEKVLQAIRTLGEQVIPHFRRE